MQDNLDEVVHGAAHEYNLDENALEAAHALWEMKSSRG